jgi:DNA polymerase
MGLEIFTFDWVAGLNYPYHQRQIISKWDVAKMGIQETQYERKHRMLRQLSLCCSACTCCELGRKDINKDNIIRDPHVLSNMNPVRYMVVGQGPGMNEIIKGTPFIGQSGKNFDKELSKYNLSRNDFYISNAIRCFIEGNAKPNKNHLSRCKPFLDIEINLIHPHFIITLGATPFEVFCPDKKYSESLGSLHYSKIFDVKVFAVYHPSPLNLMDATRKCDFERQMKIVCRMINRIKQKTDNYG